MIAVEELEWNCNQFRTRKFLESGSSPYIRHSLAILIQCSYPNIKTRNKYVHICKPADRGALGHNLAKGRGPWAEEAGPPFRERRTTRMGRVEPVERAPTYIYIYSFSRRFYPKRLPKESFTKVHRSLIITTR